MKKPGLVKSIPMDFLISKKLLENRSICYGVENQTASLLIHGIRQPTLLSNPPFKRSI